MNALTVSAPGVKAATAGSTSRTGLALSALPVLFLLFDATLKLLNIDAVAKSSVELGLPTDLSLTIGILELVCLALYVIPRTAVLGAILLTGYLGGAIAIHVRVGNPLFSHVLFPIYVALPLWAGLYLRDERLRALLPLRR